MEPEEKKKSPITFDELRIQLYHPPPSESPLFRVTSTSTSTSTSTLTFDNPHQSLSFLPWRLQSTRKEGHREDVLTDHFPTSTYLDLRRQQNRVWADDRLSKGNEQFFLDPAKADAFYQEGLDLFPAHLDLLVAQAKLWIQRRNRPHAAKAQLEECLKLDPNHRGAKELLDRFNRQDAVRRGAAPKVMPQTRETAAFQDVLMERNLAMDSTLLLEGDDDYDSVQSSERDKESKKKKKKRKSKKKSKNHKKHDMKKRKKKRRYDSSSDDDSLSIAESDRDGSRDKSEHGHNSTTGRKKVHHRRRERKRRRRRHDSDLSVSEASVDGDVFPSVGIGDNKSNSDNDSEKSSEEPAQTRHKRRKSERKEIPDSFLGADPLGRDDLGETTT